MNPIRLLGWLRSWHQDRSALRAYIKSKKQAILNIPETQRKPALLEWKGELKPQIEQHHSEVAARQWTRRGQFSINFRAAFTLLMLLLAIYQAVATPLLPFPGWELMGTIYANTLPAVGLAYGMVNLLLTRLIIARIGPDEKTRRYVQRLQDNTGGQGRRYKALWVWSVGFGGTPWLSIIMTAVDLAVGLWVAQFLFNLFYHYQHVDVLVTTAVIILSQMWFGGLAWIAQMLSQYGFSTRQEKAFQWVEAQIKQIEEPDENVSTVWYWFVLTIRTVLLVGGLLTYVVIMAMFYFGFLAKPHLTGSESWEVKSLLLVGGITSGMFFACVVSMFINTGHTRKQKLDSAKAAIKNILLSLPTNISGTFGNFIVGAWGSGYSTANANVLSVVWQQILRVTVGQLTTIYNARKRRKEARQASQEQAANPHTPQISATGSPFDEVATLVSNFLAMVQATGSISNEIAPLVSDLLAMALAGGQQWTDKMEQAGQIKDDLAQSILEQHARLASSNLGDLYCDPQPFTSMQTEANQLQEQLTHLLLECLREAADIEKVLRAGRQVLGGTGSGEQTSTN